MSNILQYVNVHWVEWLFLAISALLGLGYKKLSGQLKAEREKNTALHDGMQALLRDRIIQAYNQMGGGADEF